AAFIAGRLHRTVDSRPARRAARSATARGGAPGGSGSPCRRVLPTTHSPVVLAATCALNAARFGDPFEVGYRYLRVAWHARIEKWGLFSYHYLARNLGVLVTSLPWLRAETTPARASA